MCYIFVYRDYDITNGCQHQNKTFLLVFEHVFFFFIFLTDLNLVTW